MADEETSENAEQEAPPKKKSKKLLIIIVAVILVIVIGVVVFFVFFTGGKKSEQAGKVNTNHTQKIQSSNQNSANLDNTISLAKVGVLYPLDTFIVNLVSSNNHPRYLKTKMSLELSNKDLAAELEAKKAVLRDKIIGVLSSKSYQQIATIQGKNKLAQDIVNALNPMLSDGSIEGVFFTEFVVQ